MRPDVDLLRDIVKTASELDLIVAGLDEDTFSVTDVVRSAAMYKLIVIGEAAAKLSDGLREQFGHVPWPAIISFRNRATRVLCCRLDHRLRDRQTGRAPVGRPGQDDSRRFH